MAGRAEPERSLAALSGAAERVRPVALAGERVLAVEPALAPLLPFGGLQRGSVVGVSGAEGGGATSLALALTARASREGSWVAAVGLPSLGLAAAAELGVSIGRLALVAAPGPELWSTVVAALVDAFDVVVLRLPPRLRAGDARRLAARARERGAVMLALWPGSPAQRSGPTGPLTGAAAPLALDVHLQVATSRWSGLGEGHGHLTARLVEITAQGRRAAARPRAVSVWLPDPTGEIRGFESPPMESSGTESILNPCPAQIEPVPVLEEAG